MDSSGSVRWLTGSWGGPRALAVHPSDSKTLAIATSAGVYVSRDSGASFKSLAQGEQGLSVFFDLDSKHLWYGTFAGVPRLKRFEIMSGKISAVALPALGRDAVAYIAQNPVNTTEYAIATFERSVCISNDAGKSWKQIVDRGNGK